MDAGPAVPCIESVFALRKPNSMTVERYVLIELDFPRRAFHFRAVLEE
jgi:hypothetical protein